MNRQAFAALLVAAAASACSASGKGTLTVLEPEAGAPKPAGPAACAGPTECATGLECIAGRCLDAAATARTVTVSVGPPGNAYGAAVALDFDPKRVAFRSAIDVQGAGVVASTRVEGRTLRLALASAEPLPAEGVRIAYHAIEGNAVPSDFAVAAVQAVDGLGKAIAVQAFVK